jgi:hypothetical protein
MKKILTLFCFLFISIQAFTQTDGITYQAVIISPDALELPGVDSEGNYLPNATIAVRFTIYDQFNQLEFQEVQITDTDAFGRINLLIGDGNHDYFKEMNWDGTPKDLKVEIDFDAGNDFTLMSRERLTFLPYAFHRNITATGTLTVDDRTFLNGELEVEGPTTLESTLDVINGNATHLTGSLDVDGETNLNAPFNVNNNSTSTLTGDLIVNNNSALDGTLNVLGNTTLNDLTVNGEANFGDLSATNLKVTDSTTLQGGLHINTQSQVRVNRIFQDNFQLDTNIDHHVMLIEGGRQGLAIKVNGSRDNTTNFITFFDEQSENSWGRIEGEREDEFTNNADYNFDIRSLDYDKLDASIDALFSAADIYAALTGTAMAFSSSTGCAGFGACVTAPIPSMIFKYTTESVVVTIQAITATAGIVIAFDNKNDYEDNKVELQGVTYASGAGDYAEYLLREDLSETMTYGDIVGVKAGKISKDTENAERMMVVSYKPIVLGNMPQENREQDYEKVAFMGQVPVKVFGKVSKGDYIIPSGKHDGIGVAISPEKITLKDINKIVGTAWTESQDMHGINLINVVVGINTNDNNRIVEALESKVHAQQIELNNLKDKVNEILELLAVKVDDEVVEISHNEDAVAKKGIHNERKYEVLETAETDIIYFEITKNDIENAIVEAEVQMKEFGMYEANKEVWNKLKTDAKFKTDFTNELHANLQKQMHYHKEIDKGGRH